MTFGSICAAALIGVTIATHEPLYTVAAGLFEIAGVLYAVTRPIRLKEVSKQ